MKIRTAREDESPKCPHCAKELTEVITHDFDKGFFSVTERCLYYCPHCHKVLGVGQHAAS